MTPPNELCSASPMLVAAGVTVGSLFEQQAHATPDRIAIVEGETEISYGRLNSRVNQLVAAFAANGVASGDMVAVVSGNRLEFVEIQLAAAKHGAIVACPNWRQSDEELAHCLSLTRPRLVFVSPPFQEQVARLDLDGARIIVFGEAFEALLADCPDSDPRSAVSPEDPLLILFTSGTTGFPKGAVISHRAMVARTMIAMADETMFPTRTFVCWAPLFHMAGADNALGLLMLGGKLAMMDSFDAERLVDLLANEEIGLLSLGPGTVERLIAELAKRPVHVRGVSLVGAMADLVAPARIAAVTKLLNAPYRNTFGSTETGIAPASRGRIPVGVVPRRFSKVQSSFCSVRLVDPEGRDVPDGEPGEILFRGPSLFSGYWQAHQTNAEDFRDGWFHMGDVMVRNADGTLDFVERRKYLIKSGGENIYPAEIERVLMASEDIAEAAVVRTKDARWGEVPVVFVVARKPGLTADDVLALLRGRVASFKLPKGVHFLADDEVPRSTTGKIRRNELEARLAAIGAGRTDETDH
jgi:acyl-CoA synthetase (AMP-forming)/AMP-acid ligase II